MTRYLTIVTGGNRGLEKELCRTLLTKHNHDILLLARDAQKAEAAASELSTSKHTVQHAALDVSKPAEISRFLSTDLPGILASNPTSFITLVNNAGIYVPDWESTRLTNIEAPARLSRGFIQAFNDQNRRGGRIITLSSGLGNAGCQSAETLKTLRNKYPTLEEVVNWKPVPGAGSKWEYDLSKHLVNYLTEILAQEGVPLGISVHAVDPGWCKTDMGGAGATSSKEEGVDTSAWLASLSEEAGLKLTGKVYNRRKELLWKTV